MTSYLEDLKDEESSTSTVYEFIGLDVLLISYKIYI